MESQLNKQKQISSVVANQIIRQLLEDSIIRGIANQKLSRNCSQSQNLFGTFLGNFIQQITHTTAIPSDKSKILASHDIVLNKLDSEPQRTSKQQFAVKLQTKYLSLQQRALSELRLPSRKNTKTLKKLPPPNAIPQTEKIEDQPIVQRKKYFSQYNKKPENRFHKLKINYQNKQDEEEAIKTQQIHQNMRNLKKGLDIFTKFKFFNKLAKPQQPRKSKSLPVKDFPLLENVNPVQYVITKSIKNTETSHLHQQEQKSMIKIESNPIKKPLNGCKSKMKIQRQNESKDFFEHYHSQPEQQRLQEAKLLLNQNSQIKIADDYLDISVAKQSKQKRLLSKNILQANKKSLTILGGRQRRTSNVKIGPIQHKAQFKLPNLKTNLKIVPRNKQNCEAKNRPSFGKVTPQCSEKINVNNRMSLQLMLKDNNEVCTNSDHKVQKEQAKKQGKDSLFKSYISKGNAVVNNGRQSGHSSSDAVVNNGRQSEHSSSDNQTESTQSIEGLSSIHLGVVSRIEWPK